MNASYTARYGVDESAWESVWAPYDQPTYQAVLDYIHPDDTVLEIGAGDFRLARQIARTARQVIGIEIQKPVFEQAMASLSTPLPKNLAAFLGDARSHPFQPGITLGVLLMRHCQHFRLYADKLKAVGCQRLITNARWRLGVEQIFLDAPRVLYNQIKTGWYACWCGAAGFKPGPVDEFTPELDAVVFEVIYCPNCRTAEG